MVSRAAMVQEVELVVQDTQPKAVQAPEISVESISFKIVLHINKK